MGDTSNVEEGRLRPKGLTRSQIITVWVGLAGSAMGCSAWMLAMAGMGGDWMAFGLTAALDVFMVFVFARLSLRHPTWRFPLLAAFIVFITAHCLAMYWWRYEMWRGAGEITPEELLREKEILTMTIVAMIIIVLAQFVVVYLLQANSRRNRKKVSRTL
jgi:glucan phosphoethanolaminetransferase (alkaline phosphatase superfamily)